MHSELEKLTNLKEKLKVYYQQEGEEDCQEKLYKKSDWIHNTLKDIVIRGVKARIKSTDIVLDLGCAEGLYTREIANYVKKVIGVDISEPKIRRARQKSNSLNNIEYLVADAEDTTFRNNCFSKVISVETLEHIPNIEEVLKNIYNFCKNDAYFFVSIPTEKDERFGKDKLRRTWLQKSGHVHSFGRREFRRLLRKYSFCIEKEYPLDILGPRLRHIIILATQTLFLQYRKSRNDQKSGKAPAPLPRYSSFWYRLDEFLSRIPILNRRSSYVIFITKCCKK